MKQSMYKNGLFSPSCFTDHGLEAESTFGRDDESLRPMEIVHISRVILYESSPEDYQHSLNFERGRVMQDFLP